MSFEKIVYHVEQPFEVRVRHLFRIDIINQMFYNIKVLEAKGGIK